MKTNYINILLILILLLVSIYILYIFFNNKHNEIFNDMNLLILKEKFNTNEIGEEICDNVKLECESNNAKEGCENATKYQEYCDYLKSIKDVLKSDVLSCNDKNTILAAARRVKCLSLAGTIDESTYNN